MTSPTDTGALQALLERVEGASGPDREIDAVLMAQFYRRGLRKLGVQESGPNGWRYIKSRCWVDPATNSAVTTAKHGLEFTSSLDRALALVKRVLPGAWIELSGPRKYLHIPTPVPNYWRAECGCVGWGATPALALLAALLKALLAKHGRDET
jgi:hypothetical protein